MDNKNYGANVNQAIFNLIQPGSHKIMDIGCAEGELLSALKNSGKASYTVGVEVSDIAAEESVKKIDELIQADIEKEALDTERFKSFFDYIIYADVIEHLKDPWTVIKNHKELLAPHGKMLFCIPNTRNLMVVTDLIRGFWTYTDWGLLDVRHIRFFTRQSIHVMLHDLGLMEEKVVPIFKEASWYPADNRDESIVNLYDTILKKYLDNQDCTQELAVIFGNFQFPREAVAEFLSGQFVIQASAKHT